MAAPKRNRFFRNGEQVVVKKKTHLLDKERKHEGIPRDKKTGKFLVPVQPIDEDVTGIEGEVESGAYLNAQRGEFMVPIRVGNGGVIAVPESRLERAANTPTLERSDPSGPSAVSKETLDFWRSWGRKEAELKQLRREKREGQLQKKKRRG